MKKIFTFLFLITLTITIQGQSVRASVESSEVYLGQPFEYRIIVEGSTEAKMPELGNIDGISISYKGASTSMISSLGLGANRSSKTITYSWSFSALRTGSLIIPSFEIEIEGKTYKTASGTIIVKDPEPLDGYYLFLESEKDVYWLGEPVILTIKWLFSSSVSSPSFNLPFINSGLFHVENQVPIQGTEVFKLDINGLDVLAMQSAEIYKGDQYSTLSFSLKIVPDSSGIFELGPITLAFESAERSNGFRTTYNSAVIPSNSISLEIKEIPVDENTKNKPDILSKGTLSISASASPLRVHIGDPLTYTIKLKNAVSPETVEFPKLNTFKQMMDDFSIPDRRSPGKVEENSVSFTQTIRVKNSNVESIPALEIPYFNIETGKSESVIIAPIPIDVLETDVVTSANLESTGYESIDNSIKKELINNDQGLLFNYSIEKMISGKGGNRERVLGNPLYWIFLVLPLLIYSAFGIFKYRTYFQLISEKFSKRNSGFTKKYNELKANDTSNITELKKAIVEYLLIYCDQQGKYLTPDEISRFLIRLNNENEIVERIHDLLTSFDESEYSSSEKDMNWRSILDEFYALTKEMK